MNVYDEVEREARADHADWLADEWDGPDFDPYFGDEPLTECPVCGGPLTVDPADPSVGIFGDAVFCENTLPDGTYCMWPPEPE